MILIDTDVCVELLRGNQKVINTRKAINTQIGVSFMTAAELYYGAEKSGREKNVLLVEQFLLTVKILHSELGILQKFGELKSLIQQKGELLPDADIFIAATALEKCDQLITGNEKHFSRFPDLNVANWIKP